MRLRSMVSAAVILGVGLLSASPAAAKGHLDPSFGEAGVVDLSADIRQNGSLGAMAVAPDGSIYFTEVHRVCLHPKCRYAIALKRYRPGGALDRRFGNGRLSVGRSTDGWREDLSVDSSGRPLVAWGKRKGLVVICRLQRNGRPDRSFGGTGAIQLRCSCNFGSLTQMSGGRLLVAGYAEYRDKEVRGSIWVMTTLRANGSIDRRFGRRGWVRRRMPWFWGPSTVAASRSKALVASFRPHPPDVNVPFVTRISSAGRFDQRFSARARSSLRGVYQTRGDDYGWEYVELTPRPRGGIDVRSSSEFHRDVMVRLPRSGKRDRSFDGDGVLILPYKSSSATTDGAWGTFVVGYRRGRFWVSRLGRRGRIDRSFGDVALPNAFSEPGPGIAAQGRGRAIVFDRNETICRGYCPSRPKLFRVVR